MDPIEDEDRDPIERRDQHAFEYTMHEGQGPLSVEHHFAMRLRADGRRPDLDPRCRRLRGHARP